MLKVLKICSWSIKWYIEGILKANKRYIHCILNGIQKINFIVY